LFSDIPYTDTSSFGFAKYYDVRDSELCIRGFYKLGYEVGFARVSHPGFSTYRRITDIYQESFNSRLKAEGDETSTNLYVSNLPRNMTESVCPSIDSVRNFFAEFMLGTWCYLYGLHC
jgi:hypothetical protein